MERKLISIVLGTYNRLRFLKLTIDSVRQELKECSFSHEIIVVDGGSTNGTLKWLARQKDIITIVQHNRGEWRDKPIERRSWGYFMNLGFKCAQGKYVCMLSDDCLVVPGAIMNGVTLFEERLATGENVGAVAFYWRNWPEQVKYWVGVTFGTVFVNHGLYLRKSLEEVSYIDEEYYHFYHADSDLCLRMSKAGFITIISENSYIEHHSHANIAVRLSNMQRQKEDWQNYLKRWMSAPADMLAKESGVWMSKEYIDTYNTCSKFNRSSIRAYNLVERIIQKLESFLRW